MAQDPIEIPLEVKVENVLPNAAVGWNPAVGEALYLPVQRESDVVMAYAEVTTDKLGNSSEQDIYTLLSTWKIFDNLSAGAWDKFITPDSAKYFEPVFTAGTNTPLAWTYNAKAALMPGCGIVTQDAAGFSFKEFEQFKSRLFGLDTKNYRVWSERAGTWQYYAGSGDGWTSTVLAGTITGAANNGSGLIRITSNSHGMQTGDKITVANVTGTTEANNTNGTPVWTITRITANTFDLQGSTFTNAYVSGGSWKADAAGLRFEPTELCNLQIGGANYLIVGQTSGWARRSLDADTTTPVWQDFTDHSGVGTEAQHFAVVGQDIYYSKDAAVYNRTTGTRWLVGDQNKKINRLLWWNNYLIITKPEGVWVLLPDVNSLQKLMRFDDYDDDNGKVLIVHQNNAYWNQLENWFKWDGFNAPTQEIAEFDGNDNRAFYRGKVRGASSDGRNLYLVYRVTTSDASPYTNDFILIQHPRTLGYHPVYVSSSQTTPPSNYIGAVIFESNKLRFSVGVNTTTATGYLLTDGNVPMSASSVPYTWGVGITTGYFDASRAHVPKWVFKNAVSTKDISSTGTGNLTLSYQRWNDTSFTAYPSVLTGTNDRAEMTPTAATETPSYQNAAGFTANKVQWKLVLNNTGNSTQKEKLFYVESFFAIGMAFYEPVNVASVTVPILRNGTYKLRTGDRTYNSNKTLAGLRAMQVQVVPMYVTLPLLDARLLMTCIPNPAGLRIESVRDEDSKVADGQISIDLKEMK